MNFQTTKKEKDYNGGFERMADRKSRDLVRRRVITAIVLAALVCVFSLLVVFLFFRVKTIEVVGNNVYNDNEIISYSGFKKGTNIYNLDVDKAIRDITDNFAFIKSVKIEKNIPSTVVIECNCDDAVYYVEIGNLCYAISHEMRVLDQTSNLNDLTSRYPNIKKLVTSDVDTAIVGRDITFVRDNYFSSIKDFLQLLETGEKFEGMTTINVTDKYEISMVYDHRLKINLGDMTDADLKLRFAYEIINDLDDQSGVIDIEDVEMGYVILSYGETYD